MPTTEGKPARPAGQKIEEFAEDLGRLLGTARAKAEGWLNQRQAISKHLTDIRDTASSLLNQLGQQADTAVRRVRHTRPSDGTARDVAPQPMTKRKRRKMSARARKAISDAQKRRWAAQRASEKK